MRWTALSALLLVCFLPSTAQNDECCIIEEMSDLTVPLDPIYFDSGSRGKGMGGAFIALADDASAAFINPAGLSRLARPSAALVGSFPSDDRKTLGTLSLAFPYKNWTVALFGGRLAAFDSNGPDSDLDLDITNIGVSVAYIVSDKFYLGAGYTSYNMDLRATDNLDADFTLEQVVADSDEAAQFGFMARFSETWSLAGYWRDGGGFRLDARLVAPMPFANQVERTYRLASALGIGVSYRPIWATRFLFQIDQLETSDKLEVATPLLARDLLGFLLNEQQGVWLMDDTTQYRFGFEYTFWGVKWIPALRAGIFLDDASGLYFAPDEAESGDGLPTKQGAATSYSLGAGLVFNESTAVEGAMVYTSDRTSYSLSISKRF